MNAAAAQRFGAGRFFGERKEPGYLRAFALAFGVHAVLLAVLFLGVRFQSHAPESISVELWEPPAPVRVETPKAPPKVEPEPPKVEPKPEPKIEKPEIVEKPAPKPKPEPKKAEPPKPKPEPKKVEKPAPPKRDLELERRVREELAREQAAAQSRELKDALAREQASAQSKALAGWVARIAAKIRSNIPTQVVQEVQGNPEAIFDVTLLPTGEVLTARMRKSSGHKGYDEAVERAILKSSPLPKPDQPSLFQRQLELRFRPQDK